MSRRIKSAVWGYGVAVAAVIAAVAASALFLHFAGPKFPGYGFLFLLAIVVAAWRGYGPGLLAVLLSFFAVPAIFNPRFHITGVDPTRFIETLLITLLVSATAAARRRSEQALRRSNQELEGRVAERTAELERINRALSLHEEELQRTHGQLNDVLDSVSEFFLALDREFRLIYANRRILEWLGRPAEEVLGKVIWDIFPEARETEFYPQYSRVMEEKVSAYFQVFYPSTGVWFEATAHPTAEGLSAYVVDITQRKRDDLNLARLASIVESSTDAIVSKDLEGTILTWNAGAERVYGYKAEEAVGRSIGILLPEPRFDEEREILDRLRQGERIDNFDTTRVRKDGREIHISLTISPIRNAAGEIVGASHIARDITDRKAFQEQLRQMQKLESLGVLAGGVAHDFNNLLVGIVGNASLVLEDATPQNRAALHDIVTAGQRAADLTRQLLAYAGKGRIQTRLIDLSALVREIDSLIRTSTSRSVQVRLELEEGLPPIAADPGQMQQIVMNLVINAAEAISPDRPGSVLVTTHSLDADAQYLASTFGVHELKPGRYAGLEVHDSGCGMDEATIARIFDPFFTTKFLGRGLGLSAVLGIVRTHKGALKVYSAPGRGTTFKVLFPVAEGHAAEPEREQHSANLTGSGTVLVVDDEDLVRAVARKTLERYGYTVLEANDGAMAVRTFRDRHDGIDLVLLDLTMPMMGGEAALRQILQIKSTVPIVLSSGFNESEAMQRFAGKGVAAFIQKPWTGTRLAETVKSALAGSAASAT